MCNFFGNNCCRNNWLNNFDNAFNSCGCNNWDWNNSRSGCGCNNGCGNGRNGCGCNNNRSGCGCNNCGCNNSRSGCGCGYGSCRGNSNNLNGIPVFLIWNNRNNECNCN